MKARESLRRLQSGLMLFPLQETGLGLAKLVCRGNRSGILFDKMPSKSQPCQTANCSAHSTAVTSSVSLTLMGNHSLTELSSGQNRELGKRFINDPCRGVGHIIL